MTESRPDRSFRCGIVRLVRGILAGLVLAARARPGTPDLAIVAPAAGTTAMTGQALNLTVSIAPGRLLRNVSIIAENPLRSAEPLAAGGPTLQFRVAVPSSCAPGLYVVRAVGVGEGGALALSQPIKIRVERADAPRALDLAPSAMILAFVGESRAFQAVAAFSDGTHTDVGRSTRLTAIPANPAVAIVRDSRIVALGSGQTVINIRYGVHSAALPVEVARQHRGDLNADGRVDASDVEILTRSLHQPATVIGDARDLNQDGLIDEFDRAILVSLCTKQGCAP